MASNRQAERKRAALNHALEASRQAFDLEYQARINTWRLIGRWLIRSGLVCQGILGYHLGMAADRPWLAMASLLGAGFLVSAAVLWRRMF